MRVVCGRERPLRLFEVLARNRQSAVGLWRRTRAHENNQLECLQYLLDNDCPLPRGWRYEDGELHVCRIRIRIRIRIIARVLKPPHPCNTKERKRETTKHSRFFSRHFLLTRHTYANNKARKNDERFFLLWLLVLPPKSERRRRITSAISSRCCCGRDEDDDKC